MRSRSGTRNVVTSVLSIALFLAIAALAILVALQLRSDKLPRFDVAVPQGVDCPAGEGAPACFTFGVTNLGAQPSLVECIVTSDAGRASFLNDAPIYTSSGPFEPGVAEQLMVKVDPGAEGTVTEPRMVCRAI